MPGQASVISKCSKWMGTHSMYQLPVAVTRLHLSRLIIAGTNASLVL